MSNPGPRLRLVSVTSESPASSRRPAGAARPGLVEPAERDAAPPREATLTSLYEQYASYVAAIASRILGRAAEVDDVVQDVFSAAMKDLRRRENAHEVKGWFATVTVRLCVRQLRVRRLWALVDLAADPTYERLADPAAGPEERQLVIEVYRALDRLPAHERVAWTLRHVEGESLDRVASLCDCSLATAKRRVASAHEKLSVRLKGRAP